MRLGGKAPRGVKKVLERLVSLDETAPELEVALAGGARSRATLAREAARRADPEAAAHEAVVTIGQKLDAALDERRVLTGAARRERRLTFSAQLLVGAVTAAGDAGVAGAVNWYVHRPCPLR